MRIFRCILALKRNDEDLIKTSLFLKQRASGAQTSAKSSEEASKTMNGVSPKPVLEGKFGFKPGFPHTLINVVFSP